MFLSHTSELSNYPAGRSFVQAAKDAVNRVSDAVVEMSYFGPSGASPSAISTSRVVWSDVFVGIIGMRYGSPVQEKPELSYTELEFEAATEQGMRRRIFLLDERSAAVPAPIGPPELDARQAVFRDRLLHSGVTVTWVSNPAELEVQLVQTLYELPDITTIANERDPALLAGVRRDLLLQVHDLVVEQQESLDRLVRIELSLLEQRSAVARPLNRVLQRVNEPDRPLPSGQRISELFRDLGSQFLILGEPGAGKTTLLYELARDLLEEAVGDPGAPVPTVVHLSSWVTERSRLDLWLVEELHRTYGLARELGAQWLAAGHIVPLLDGLDEVDQEHRGACVNEINAFRDRHAHLPFAVCCRATEYRVLRNRLVLHNAVLILPLKRDEIERYVEHAGQALAGVGEALRRDEALWDLLTTPLFLNLIAVTYRGRSLDEIEEARTLQKLRSDVLTDYVRRMLERVPATPVGGYGRRDMAIWLRWMGTAMTSASQSVFHLDLIQPSWLPITSHRRLVTIGVPVALGMLAALLAGAVLVVDGGLRPGNVVAVAYVLLTAMAFGLALAVAAYQPDIRPTVQFGWSWRALRQSLPSILRSTVIAASAYASAFGLAAATLIALGPRVELGTPTPPTPFEVGLLVLAQVAATGAGVGVAIALTAGIHERYAIEAPFPGYAMRATRRNWFVGTLILGLPAALVVLLAQPNWGQSADSVLLKPFFPQFPTGGPPVVLALAAGSTIGLAIGPLIRLLLPVEPRQHPFGGLLVGLMAAILLGPAQFVFARLVSGLVGPVGIWLVPGVPVWPFAGTLAGLIVAFGGSIRAGAAAGVIAAVIAGATFQVQHGIGPDVTVPPATWLLFATGVAVAVGIRLGGGAYLRHWTLRWFLTRHGLLPWDPITFLEHATRIHLLRRRGGGYEFIHRLVQEHFAAHEG